MIAGVIRAGLLAAGAGSVAMGASMGQDQLGWGRATQLIEGDQAQNAALASAIVEWKSLTQSNNLPFESYARFLIAHPGWPSEMALRRTAEKALAQGNWSPSTVAAFFRRYPPLTNAARAAFAQALLATGARDEATLAAVAAWRGGVLSPTDETTLLTSFPGAFTQDDQDQRMDMLLWQGQTSAAARQLPLTSMAKRDLFAARLAMRTKSPDAPSLAAATSVVGASDAGWLADRSLYLRSSADLLGARALLARPHDFAQKPAAPGAWLDLLSSTTKSAAADAQYSTAFAIARQLDDAYPAGTDIASLSYSERDDYTDLAWLAGQAAMKRLGRPGDAIGLFTRYANASKGPAVQSKGFYWAGRAAEAAGRRDEANGYYGRAAGFRDLFYGQLAAERLGQPLVAPGAPVMRPVDPAARTAFYRSETVRAAQYLGTTGNWIDQTAFVRQIALDAKTDSDHVLADELSRSLGRPDLGVMVGRSALQNGITDYSTLGFPTVRVPAAANDSWVMVHAIARQESQFDRGAVSRTGARGLMQLMPGTAREQAGKLGLAYDATALTSDTDLNITLGSAYFQRIYAMYGSYPLAIAAYNAGAGNVNKWLAANGDPRMGTVDWVDWIEAIPFSETRGYVQRVLENAVVYDLMNPQRARSTGTARLSWYIGNKRPG